MARGEQEGSKGSVPSARRGTVQWEPDLAALYPATAAHVYYWIGHL